jgi:hypothetical protein
MSIENRAEESPQFNQKDLREAFASIDALNFVLGLDGNLDPSIDREKLIRYQANLILKDVKDILPDLDGIRVNGVVALRPDCEEAQDYNIFTLGSLDEILSDMGKEQGFLEEVKIPGYSSDG